MFFVGREFYHLATRNHACIERERDERAHLLPTLRASSTGIDGEHRIIAIGNHFKNVAMAAHQNFRVRDSEALLDAWRISPRVAANVRHHHLHALHLKDFGLLESAAQILSVGIAPHCPKHRHKGCQAVDYLLVALRQK